MSINPTVYEQYLLELVNRARANPDAEAGRLGIGLNDSLAGGTISSAAKQPLVFHQALIEAAGAHSDWMLETDTFSHAGVGGSDPGTRMENAGYRFDPPASWGENIAWDGTTGQIDLAASVISNHDALFRSAGHRANLMNGAFKEIGLGVETGSFSRDGSDYDATMVTQNFAYSGRGSFLTGVVIDDGDGDRFYDIGEQVGGATISATGASGTFQTTSWNAGGYRLELPPGAYDVTVTIGDLEHRTTMEIGPQNIKIDVFTNELQPGIVSRDDTAPADPNVVVAAPGETVSGTDALDTVSFEGSRAGYDISKQAEDVIFVAAASGAGQSNLLVSIERLQFEDGTLAFDLGGNAGQAYRIYQAAFDRVPDGPGLAGWIDAMDKGMELIDVAASFLGSEEFASVYGSDLSDETYVAALYDNVLGRAGEAAGVDYWQGLLADGTTRAHVLAGFSEGPENVAGVAASIEDGIWYG